VSDSLPVPPEPPAPARDRRWLHIGLVLLTLLTTTVAGIEFYASFASDLGRRPVNDGFWSLLLGGLWFSVPAMLILGAHEMGHYLACRYYGLRSSLPYFIPMLPFLPIPGVGLLKLGFGTLGAVIRIREPILWRRVLFDVGIGGPLAGVLVAFPVMAFAILSSRVVPYVPTANSESYGDPLAFRLVAQWIFGTVRDGYAINLHPSGFAAWFGMLVTFLNLIPAGQLDGGHIAYACVGRRAIWLTRLSCVAAVAGGVLLTPMWWFWLVFMSVLFTATGWRHAPVLDEGAPLGATRWVLALIAVAILVLCFMPIPLQ
jgi:membrane-associated protease RseP (regulator of RpoE activity)